MRKKQFLTLLIAISFLFTACGSKKESTRTAHEAPYSLLGINLDQKQIDAANERREVQVSHFKLFINANGDKCAVDDSIADGGHRVNTYKLGSEIDHKITIGCRFDVILQLMEIDADGSWNGTFFIGESKGNIATGKTTNVTIELREVDNKPETSPTESLKTPYRANIPNASGGICKNWSICEGANHDGNGWGYEKGKSCIVMGTSAQKEHCPAGNSPAGEDGLCVGCSSWAKEANNSLRDATDVTGLSQLSNLENKTPFANLFSDISNATYRVGMDSKRHPVFCSYTASPSWMPAEDLVAVGLSDDIFKKMESGGQSLCGQCLRITNLENGKMLTAIIADKGWSADRASGYVKPNTIDVSVGGFKHLRGDFVDNLKKIKVEPVRCDFGSDPKIEYLLEASTAIDSFFSINIRRAPFAIKKLEFKSTAGAWINADGAVNNRWLAKRGTLSRSQRTIQIRMTAINGSVFEDQIKLTSTTRQIINGTISTISWK